MSAPGWKVRFYTIWTGQALSLVGSALVRFALIWWLTEQTGSAAVLATASLAPSLTGIVLGPFVGTLVDRWNRRRIMVLADGAIAACTALLAFLYWRGVVEAWQIYVILSLRAVGTAFHDPAMTASTSLMVPRDQLTRVAGMNQVRNAVTQLGGVPLAALLVAWLPIQAILAIDVVTALLAIVPLLFIDIPQPDPAVTRGHGWRAAVRETGDGFRYLWSWRGLLIVCLTFSLVPFFNQPANALRPLLIKAHFGGGPVEWGWTSMAAAAGSLAGGLLMSTWGGFKRRLLTMLTGLTVFGLVKLVQGLAPAHALWLFISAMLLSGPAAAMGFGALRAIMQSTVPPEMQGRVFSLRISLFGAMAPLGLAVLGPLAETIGIRAIYLLDGAACLLVALLWSVTRSVRNLEKGPLEQGERIECLSFGK